MNDGIKKYIFFTSIILLLSIMLGFFTGRNDPELARKAIGGFSAFDYVKELNPFFVFLIIFLNNSIKTLAVLFLGFFFGIAPFFFIFFNGYVIGLVVFVAAEKIGALNVLAALAPHGVLELPAVVIAGSYGIWLGAKFYRKVRYGEPFRWALSFVLKKYSYIVLPALFIAAIIEAYISAQIINRIS